MEQHFVEAQTMHKDLREENVIEAKKQLFHKSVCGNKTSHKSARDGKIITKGDGDGEA